jgi:hypothetical protein
MSYISYENRQLGQTTGKRFVSRRNSRTIRLIAVAFLVLSSVSSNVTWLIKVYSELLTLVAPGDVVSVTGVVKILGSEEGKGGKGNKNKASSMFVLYLDANSLVKASTNPGGGEDDSSAFTKDYMQFSEKDLSGIRKIAEFGGNNVRL